MQELPVALPEVRHLALQLGHLELITVERGKENLSLLEVEFLAPEARACGEARRAVRRRRDRARALSHSSLSSRASWAFPGESG